MVRAGWIVVAMLAGCGTDPAQMMMQPTPQHTELVGDWFLCTGATCTTLRNVGAHWDGDGTWVLLEARGAQSLGPTDTYCASPHDANRGIYTFDDAASALAMTDDLGRDAGSATVTFAEPVAQLAQHNGVTSVYMRIDPPRSDGDCPIN